MHQRATAIRRFEGKTHTVQRCHENTGSCVLFILYHPGTMASFAPSPLLSLSLSPSLPLALVRQSATLESSILDLSLTTALQRSGYPTRDCKKVLQLSSTGLCPQIAPPSPTLPRSVIRKEAWLFCRASSGVRLYWELEQPKGPKGGARATSLCTRCASWAH